MSVSIKQKAGNDQDSIILYTNFLEGPKGFSMTLDSSSRDAVQVRAAVPAFERSSIIKPPPSPVDDEPGGAKLNPTANPYTPDPSYSAIQDNFRTAIVPYAGTSPLVGSGNHSNAAIVPPSQYGGSQSIPAYPSSLDPSNALMVQHPHYGKNQISHSFPTNLVPAGHPINAAFFQPPHSGASQNVRSRLHKKKQHAPKLTMSLPKATRQVLEAKLGHIFRYPDFLWEALQAAGNGVNQIGDRVIDDGNKKLALLGDTVMRTVIMLDWYPTGSSRRHATEKAISIGKNTNLDFVGRAAGLARHINPHPSHRRRIPKTTMTATVEALIAAVYLDSGESFEAVKGAMRGLGLYQCLG